MTTTTTNALPLLGLYIANNRKEAIASLQGLSSQDKLEAVKSTISIIDTEAEMLINQGVNDIAIIKMSQVVMLEEVQMLIERLLLKEGSL